MGFEYLDRIVQISEQGTKGSVSNRVSALFSQDENLQKIVDECKEFGKVVAVVYTINGEPVQYSEWKNKRDTIHLVTGINKIIVKYLSDAPYSGNHPEKHVRELAGIGPIPLDKKGEPIHTYNPEADNRNQTGVHIPVTERHFPRFYDKTLPAITQDSNNSETDTKLKRCKIVVDKGITMKKGKVKYLLV